MIYSVAEQIARASELMTLDPGDVVLTGTPAGVGVPKGTFLAAGRQDRRGDCRHRQAQRGDQAAFLVRL